MNALRLPFSFDVSQILEEIGKFDKEDYYNIYNPSVEPDTLWSKHLIEPIGGPETTITFAPNASLQQCPYLNSILDHFQCEKETFRIHLLDGHSTIKAHRDIGYSFEHGFVRLHIPIQTNDQVKLLVNGEYVNMQIGECWYCNFHETHEVRNEGEATRIHLIMDCKVNDWLKAIFEEAQNF